jgi:hypothetical protein
VLVVLSAVMVTAWGAVTPVVVVLVEHEGVVTQPLPVHIPVLETV